MITVAIFINGQPIITRSARNTAKKDTRGKTIYLCDDGIIIKHFRDDGAVVLAKKMLDSIKSIGK